ncbi:hypothetical protein RHMOL_Rhmol01G0122600 [Rhododendron molle]|uniref:Uncharacterized protein n=1 Tax=Rhododendron molle TaxID=49168 RepID=A0ACC0Q2I4_RHOML|nr:hypothetical protein RHMOL_Rhmol01G0122600 [Rhododendron molle]
MTPFPLRERNSHLSLEKLFPDCRLGGGYRLLLFALSLLASLSLTVCVSKSSLWGGGLVVRQGPRASVAGLWWLPWLASCSESLDLVFLGLRHQHHFTTTTGVANDDVDDVLDSSFPDLRSPLIFVIVVAAASLSPAVGVALTTPLRRRRLRLLFNNVTIAPPPPPRPVLLCHRLCRSQVQYGTSKKEEFSVSILQRKSPCNFLVSLQENRDLPTILLATVQKTVGIDGCVSAGTRQPYVDCAELRTSAAPCFLKTIIILLPRNTNAVGGL